MSSSPSRVGPLLGRSRGSVRAPDARSVLRHPRMTMAVRASVAATVAWLLARALPGTTDFAFYAPFGAVATAYPAVVRSTAETLRAVTAIMLGAAVGLAVDQLVPWTLAAVGAAVGIGVLVGGLPWLGEGRSYVPIAAVFLLLIGQGQELGYATAYVGLFLLGALVTIVLNAAFPTVPLPQADAAVRALRREAGEHLAHMAGLLRGDDVGAAPPRDRLTTCLDEARGAVEDAVEASRGTRRARRYADAVGRTRADLAALERVVLLVDDLHDLSDDEPWGTRVSRVAPELRGPMAEALAALAEAVTRVGLTDTEPGYRTTVDDAVRDLAAALLEYERSTGPGPQGLVVAAVVTTLRRTLSALTPADRIELSASPWPDEEPLPDRATEA